MDVEGAELRRIRALPSIQGVVLQPLADDVTAELAVDKITVTRPGGLSLSSTAATAEPVSTFRALSFDTQLWAYNRQAKFNVRQAELTQIAAMAPPSQRKPARLNLARSILLAECRRRPRPCSKWNKPTRRTTTT